MHDARVALRHGIGRGRVRQGQKSATTVLAVESLEQQASKIPNSDKTPQALAKRFLAKYSSKPLLIEWCCYSTLEISRLWGRFGPAFRVCLPAWDAWSQRTRTLMSALIDEALAQRRQDRVWSSQECKSWCSWHRAFGASRPSLIAQRAIVQKPLNLALEVQVSRLLGNGHDTATDGIQL